MKHNMSIINEENILWSILEGTAYAILIFDNENKIIEVNRSFEKMFGWKKEELVGQKAKMESFIPDQWEDQAKEVLENVLNGKEIYSFETQRYKKDGSILDVSCTFTPILDENGMIVGGTTTHRDITEKKSAERALKESEERYRSLVETSPDVIAVHSKGKFMYMNPAGLKLLGFKRAEDISGVSITDYIHPEDRPLVRERIAKMMETSDQLESIELKVVLPKNKVINSSVSASPICYRGQSAIQVIMRDVTERVRMREQLQLILRSAGDGIYGVNQSGEITFINQSAAEMIGISEKAAIGMRMCELLTNQDEALIKIEDDPIYRSLVNGDAVEVSNQYIRRQDGTSFIVDYICTPIKENGIITGAVVSFRDVTERNNTEELLRKSDKLSVVGQLAAGVAHEIRNPLTSLKGFLQLLQKDAKDETETYYNVMLSELKRIESIIGELLVLAKPQAAKYDRVNILSILNHVITLLTSQANLKNIEIIQTYRLSQPIIEAEENHLKQVLINILKNAVEAMENQNHGKIFVSAETNEQQNELKIEIKDEGPGIAEDRISKLGEPFYSTKEKGTGLGLMICSKIIKDHGGKLSIKSELEKGTTISIVLPIKQSIQ
ncbi:PAS domain-containing sensor histidine kinase [Pseudalkalibacillus caeni]|uniref:histidine kinase n=1 Tax=Exobacillus caeni TaxID=2574798 RepID=A0A5R9F558_9BACL|nr:PAS domain-containing sensor histidine kinase [Pseudalkalibacillus caeni]TLS38161.1 PAS domain S-box protein [Pseudalkalibacillus caeni]